MRLDHLLSKDGRTNLWRRYYRRRNRNVHSKKVCTGYGYLATFQGLTCCLVGGACSSYCGLAKGPTGLNQDGMDRITIDKAINELIHEFTKKPYLFFTEADAVTRFHRILSVKMGADQFVNSQDGFKISLIHREYPTFFRFSDKNPTSRLPKPFKRGHYDTVILTPDFVEAHPAETVQNRDIKTPRDEKIVPFQAVVEFKLDNIGWNKDSAAGALAEIGKLKLSEESPLRYFVVLMRYNSPKITRWEKYWPKVKTAAEQEPSVACAFAVNWLRVKEGYEVFRFGIGEFENSV